MPNIIPETVVKSFPEFVAAVEEAKKYFDGKDLWYRGISKVSHSLVPGLFRHPSAKTIEEITALESQIYQEFTFRSPSYDVIRRDDWDRLFLMQHYRSPTRLLDWSSSPLVALFFAVTGAADPSEGAVVWVMEPSGWNAGMLNDISQPPCIFSTNDHMLETYHPLSQSKARRSQPLAMEGIINNPRINAQKGKFVIFGHQLRSQEEAAEECPVWGTQMPLAKIICDEKCLPKIAGDLNSYGVTHTSIYPDLEGLAVELKIKAGYSHV